MICLDENFVMICMQTLDYKTTKLLEILWPFICYTHSFSRRLFSLHLLLVWRKTPNKQIHLLLRALFSCSSLFTAFSSACICGTSLASALEYKVWPSAKVARLTSQRTIAQTQYDDIFETIKLLNEPSWDT